jgi:hypothetical protein
MVLGTARAKTLDGVVDTSGADVAVGLNTTEGGTTGFHNKSNNTTLAFNKGQNALGMFFKKDDFAALNASDTSSGAVGIVHNGTDLYIADIIYFGADNEGSTVLAGWESEASGEVKNGIAFQYSLNPPDANGVFAQVFELKNSAVNCTHFSMRMNYNGGISVSPHDGTGTGDGGGQIERAVVMEIDFNPDSGRCRSDIKPSTEDNMFVRDTIGYSHGAMNAGQGPTELAKRNPDVLGYFVDSAPDTPITPTVRSAKDFSVQAGLTGGWGRQNLYLARSRRLAVYWKGEIHAKRKTLDDFMDSKDCVDPIEEFEVPARTFQPFFIQCSEDADRAPPSETAPGQHRAMDALVRKPACGLNKGQFMALMTELLNNTQTVLESMVGAMVRQEFHRGGKQSGSQYFDSESTAGCGPRVSLGALQYTAACAQPIGSAPAMSQLASDIVIPQTSNAVVDPAKAEVNFATRMMIALDRSSALSKIAGVTTAQAGIALEHSQDKEVARLVKNYNPGPAYEVVSARLDTSMYSKLRTHAQMNSGFGRRAQMSAVGNHQMEDGSGKCVQVVVPLPWWYADGPACDGRRTQALPMIALQYHNVSISVNLRSFNECVQTDREHRQQPFRCSKMIGSLGSKALQDAGSASIQAPTDSFAQMPTDKHGAREGSTLMDTLAGSGAAERAVCCVNMHTVRDTLQGLRFKSAQDVTDHETMPDSVSLAHAGGGGAHLIQTDGGTAQGYQGVTDERYHVDVGTWLNFHQNASSFSNAAARGKSRFKGRVGLYDGEPQTGSGVPNIMQGAGLNAATYQLKSTNGYSDIGGNLEEWGQGKWGAQMSSESRAAMAKVAKVPLTAVFGPCQQNGGFAVHGSALSESFKYALVGQARPCAMADIMKNEQTCGAFSGLDGTMGWRVADSGSNSLGIIGAHLLVTYIFLDSAERRLFAANAHEYLITQCQMHPTQSTMINPSGSMHAINIDLNFNHPVSHMFWVLQRPESEYAREWFRYEATHGAGDPLMIKAELTLNSSKREEESYMNATNTTVIEPWNYFKKCNNTGVGGALKNSSFDGSAANIHTYSFAQNPGEWYPTGSLNFSRIDKVELKLWCKSHAESHLTHPLIWGGGGYRELNTELYNANQTQTVAGVSKSNMTDAAYGRLTNGINVRVYARNFNVLRIQSGMGAIKYAN